MRLRSVCSVLAAGLLIAACGSSNSGVTATRSVGADTTDTTPGTTPTSDSAPPDTTPTTEGTTPDTGGGTTTIPVKPGVIDFGSNKTPQPYDGFLVAAFGDIESFWAEQFPIVFGQQFAPLSGGIFAAYPARTEPIPGCGTPETKFKDVQGNAFYCSDGDFMAYDDQDLLPGLVKDLGQAAVAVVLAHEFGHAVQARANELAEPTVLKEQQADCFAGAWSAHVARGESDTIKFTDSDIKSGLIAMIQVRDPIDGGGLNDPNAHGTGFDRVGAFQDGFIGGPGRCKTFFTEGRDKKLIDIPFRPDDPNAGNLPLFDPTGNKSDIVTLIPEDLNRFWTAALAGSNPAFTTPTLAPYKQAGPFPACAGKTDADFPKNVFYCAATNQIMFDQDAAQQLATDPLLGDMSVGYLLSQAYSEAVQTTLGSALKGEARVLFNDCLTGSWVADIVPKADGSVPGNLELSAGDLDEAIITAILRADPTADTNIRGSAFEKIEAFRTGVLGGLQACTDQLS